MSYMPEPWKSVAERAGLTSYRKIAEAAGVSHGTVQRAFTGHRQSVHPDTVKGLARALRVTESWVADALDMDTDTVTPYTPPREAAYLGQRQRRAVDEMIRLLALTPEPDENDATALDPAVAYDEIARAKLAGIEQADYTPAASPHTQPDPHKDVGE